VTLAIRCSDLKKTYPGRPPVEAVRGIDLEVHAGECFGVLGPNGAGKTSTIEMIEGLLPVTSGQIEVFGLAWGKHDDAIRQRIGISLQETRLSEKLSVRETITLFRSFYRRGRQPEEVMRMVSLETKERAWVRTLSGGQKQRLAVACALVGDPDLLFLDEPTTGLDPQSRRQLWDIIRGYRQTGRTVLLTTHYMDEAEKLCDRVAIVDQGKIIALGSPRELIASLAGDHVIEFSVEDAGAAAPAPGGADGVESANWLREIPSVSNVRSEDGRIALEVTEPHLAVPRLLQHLARDGRTLTSLTTRHASLEDVFVKLTGRHLAQDQPAA
jgi:ABC-2 type transport system ATP-binding protein